MPTQPTQPTLGAIEAARIRAVYDQMPITLVAPLIVACLLVAVLFRFAHTAWLLLWVGALFAINAVRFGIWLANRRQTGGANGARHWERATLAGSAVAGLAWGLGAALLFPQQQILQFFIAFVIGGLCAGSATTNSSHMPSVLAFVWPATLPLAARFFLDGSSLGMASASMTVVFASALSLTARKFHGFFGEVFRLQFALEEKTRDLYSANARLRAEMAEHQATEASLRHAQKVEAVGRLTAGIAHDFNNLLTAILGSLELLSKRVHDPQATRLAEVASEAARRGAGLTGQLLTFARKRDVVLGPVDVNQVLRGMQDILHRTVAPLVRVVFDLDEDISPAIGDVGQLEQALLNLAVNSRDAMSIGGELLVRTRQISGSVRDALPRDLPPGDYVLISVADTGCGMSDETRSKAFDPFFTTKVEGKGSGLGLSMVYGFAKLAGGTVAIDSAQGKGTVVSLFLPKSRRAELVSDAPEIARDARIGKVRALVVDDDRDVRVVVRQMLEEMGHDVTLAENAKTALSILRGRGLFDLLLVDFVMPDMSGGELAVEARSIRPDLPILFMTGYVESEVLRKWSELGYRILAKPFRAANLMSAIGEITAPSIRAPADAAVTTVPT